MIVTGKLTRKSKKDLNDAFQAWAANEKQGAAPKFAVIASVGVATGKVRMRILSYRQYIEISEFISKVLKVRASK